MEVSKLQRRIANLESDVRKLHSRIAKVEANPSPKFISLRTAEVMFGIAAATLRFQCQAGRLDGVARKVGGKWLLETDRLESLIREGGLFKNDDGRKLYGRQ